MHYSLLFLIAKIIPTTATTKITIAKISASFDCFGYFSRNSIKSRIEPSAKEAAVTNQFHYMSLDDSADEWAKKILEVTKQERKAEIDKIRAAGYDVHDVAEYLEDFYIKKYLEN